MTGAGETRAEDLGGLRARLGRGAQAVRMAWRSSPATAGLWIGLLLFAALLPVAVAWVSWS